MAVSSARCRSTPHVALVADQSCAALIAPSASALATGRHVGVVFARQTPAHGAYSSSVGTTRRVRHIEASDPSSLYAWGCPGVPRAEPGDRCRQRLGLVGLHDGTDAHASIAADNGQGQDARAGHAPPNGREQRLGRGDERTFLDLRHEHVVLDLLDEVSREIVTRVTGSSRRSRPAEPPGPRRRSAEQLEHPSRHQQHMYRLEHRVDEPAQHQRAR